MKRLLVIEDDESLGATLSERLRREGYHVQWVKTRADAERECGVAGLRTDSSRVRSVVPFDLLILDVGLPDGSGLDFARDLRFLSDVPILFLSAMSSPEYRLEGFEIGAEDYVPKPFHLKELLLRIQRVLERTGAGAPAQAGNVEELFRLDRQAIAIVFPDGSREHPTPRDFQLLCLLIDVSPRVVSREEILEKLWPNEKQQSGRTVDNAIVRLRHLLHEPASDAIRSVRGIGYQFVPNGPRGA